MNYYSPHKIFFLILLIITKAVIVNGGLVRKLSDVSKSIKNSDLLKNINRTGSPQDKNSLETLKQFENKDLELVEYGYFLDKLKEDIEVNKSKHLENAKDELNKYKNLIRKVKKMWEEVNKKLENVKIEAAELLNKKGVKVSNKEKFTLLKLIFEYVTARNENIKKLTRLYKNFQQKAKSLTKILQNSKNYSISEKDQNKLDDIKNYGSKYAYHLLNVEKVAGEIQKDKHVDLLPFMSTPLNPSKSTGNLHDIINEAKITNTERSRSGRFMEKVFNPEGVKIKKEAKNLLPKFEGRTIKWDEINIKRIKIKRFLTESLKVDGQIFKEFEMFKENEKLFVLDQERLNKINLDANYEGKSFEELEEIIGNKSDEMKDLNGLYFQIKNKAIILYLIFMVQNKSNPSVILNNEELKECEKLLKEGEERPLKFENLKEEEFNKRTILNTIYWIYKDINGFFNNVTKKYIEYKH